MPTYEYACTSCGQHVEAVQSFSDDPLTTCPHCGGPLRKVFGAVGIVLKGSGFYKTDSRAAAPAGKGGDRSESSGSGDGPAKEGTTKGPAKAEPSGSGTGKSSSGGSNGSSANGSSSGPSGGGSSGGTGTKATTSS